MLLGVRAVADVTCSRVSRESRFFRSAASFARVRYGNAPCLPVRAKAFVVGDGILNDQGFNAIRMGERHPADRPAEVLHLQGVLGQLQRSVK